MKPTRDTRHTWIVLTLFDCEISRSVDTMIVGGREIDDHGVQVTGVFDVAV